MNNFYILISFNLLFSTLYSIISESSSRFNFINASFIIGMFYLIFGILSFVYEKGFFNITLYSFNKASLNYKKKRGIIVDEEELTLEQYINRDKSFFLTNPLLWCGALFSIVSIIISFSMI